jgi:DNA-binding PadR family transcriptional regulator
MSGRIRPDSQIPADLTATETLVLISLARLRDAAYGVAIADEIAQVSGRRISIAAAYTALDRLERLGLAKARLSAPLPERGGRARRHYTLTSRGRETLKREHQLVMKMWQGLVSDTPETTQ